MCLRAAKKPWGTGQAVLMIKGLIDCPFLVINADDYYGKEGFKRIHDYMVNEMKDDADVYDICMGGFVLENTIKRQRKRYQRRVSCGKRIP